MPDNIYWILKAKIGDDKLEELKKLAEDCCELTKSEAGVMAYEWSLTQDMGNLHIYERYEDSDAALEHMANLGKKLPKLLELVSITEIKCYGNASSDFREATKDFPILYMENLCGFRKQ
jgi:quinol monooxygenase YgiN